MADAALDVAPRLRRRNSMLEGMELFRSVRTQRSFSALILFLYACENEGLTFTELAELAGMPIASASRLIRSLLGHHDRANQAVDPPLFEVQMSPSDARIKAIVLSEEGRAMRDAFESLIAAARPIADDA
jgi:DNA-binding MarR family transcriptional regulator